MEKLEADLKRDEGREPRPYKDSLGYLTIGYGHNLDSEGLCEEAMLVQLRHDIRTKALEPLDKAFPWWRNHPENVQRVLANLCFNMGIGKLRTFKNTLRLIEHRQYKAAAVELLKSKYAKQVGQRAIRLSELLKNA